jgi:deoxyribodipyrimidine photo-lyase
MTANSTYNDARVRVANHSNFQTEGTFVLYWMQMYRRLDRNHALDYAAALAHRFGKPLVVYEGLKLGYPWASRRLHRFILEGMLDNRAAAQKLGINYWPFVETPDQPGRGLLRTLAANAVAVVTDDFPCFIIPDQTEALAKKTETPVLAVDGNGIIPMVHYGAVTSAAAHLRHRVHRLFPEAWQHRAARKAKLDATVCRPVDPPFDLWPETNLDRFLAQLPLDDVPIVNNRPGGTTAARRRLKAFVRKQLAGYAEDRSPPSAPEEGHASGLSPYLHFGHISIEEVVEAVLEASGDFDLESLEGRKGGKRQGFYSDDADVNSFLDEAITWRDLGYHWHWHRRADTRSLKTSLPDWANATLAKHADDPRPFTYSLEELQRGDTHDDLWNAAQQELLRTGTIHNYMRMLWGKKVLEWSQSPDDAYRILEHLNNKYALDGRNPNSYSGILWCFGLFDRPWGPERKIFGTVRYMSSDNTAKKFSIDGYLDYVRQLNK